MAKFGHFDMIAEKTDVCPCEMEATFKAFFNAEGTEFDGDGFLHILPPNFEPNQEAGEQWRMATDEEIDKFIRFYVKSNKILA